jgi:hypothetical protein
MHHTCAECSATLFLHQMLVWDIVNYLGEMGIVVLSLVAAGDLESLLEGKWLGLEGVLRGLVC